MYKTIKLLMKYQHTSSKKYVVCNWFRDEYFNLNNVTNHKYAKSLQKKFH